MCAALCECYTLCAVLCSRQHAWDHSEWHVNSCIYFYKIYYYHVSHLFCGCWRQAVFVWAVSVGVPISVNKAKLFWMGGIKSSVSVSCVRHLRDDIYEAFKRSPWPNPLLWSRMVGDCDFWLKHLSDLSSLQTAGHRCSRGVITRVGKIIITSDGEAYCYMGALSGGRLLLGAVHILRNTIWETPPT